MPDGDRAIVRLHLAVGVVITVGDGVMLGAGRWLAAVLLLPFIWLAFKPAWRMTARSVDMVVSVVEATGGDPDDHRARRAAGTNGGRKTPERTS